MAERGAWRRAAIIAAAVLAVVLVLYAAVGVWLVPHLVATRLPPWLKERYGLQLTLEQVRLNPFSFVAQVDGVALRGPDGAALAQVDSALVDVSPTASWRGVWHVEQVALNGLHLDLVLAKDGTLNLVTALQRLAPAQRSAPASEPARWVVDRLEIAGASMAFTDLRGAAPATTQVAPIAFNLTGLSTLPQARATHTLAIGLPDGTRIDAQGAVVLQPAIHADGQVKLTGLHAATALPFLRNSALRIDRLDGVADLQAQYAYAPADGLRLDQVALRIVDLALAAVDVPAPLVTLKALDLAGGRIDPGRRDVSFASAALSEGAVSAAFGADGSVGWSKLSPPAPAPAPAPAPGVAPADAASAAPAWHVAFDDLRLASVGVDYDDSHAASPASAHVGSLDGRLQLAVTTGVQTAIAASGVALQAHAIAVPSTGAPTVRLDTLAVDGGTFDLTGKRFAAEAVSLSGGDAMLTRKVDGSIDVMGTPHGQPTATAARRMPQPTPNARSAAATAPWGVRIGALKLEKIAAHYLDLGRRAPLRLDIGRFDASTALDATVGGASTQVAARSLQASVQSVAVSIDGRKPPALGLASATLAGGAVDLSGRSVRASSLVLAGGTATIDRDAHGRIPLLDALAPATPAAARAPPSSAAPAAPWQYTLDSLALKRFTVDATDRSVTPALAVGATLDATARHLSSSGPATFDATVTLARQGGSLHATGTAIPSSGSVQARLVTQALSLPPLQPLLSAYTTLVLSSGKLGTDMTVSYTPGRGASAGPVQATGQVGLDTLALSDAVSGAHVLSLDRLDARELAFDTVGPRLHIGDVDVVHPEMKIAIAKDHTVNLTGLVRAPAGAASSASAPMVRATPPAVAASAAPSIDLEIRRIHVSQGAVDFSDQSLVLPFATEITAIDATVGGVSGDASRHADVQARGSILPYGSASVDGSIAVVDPTRFTDLRVKFNNVTLSPFSPYTATFAGRKVQSGKLWLDLAYKIDQGAMLGNNDIRLAEFKLGDRVDSPSAIDIPLNLAVSLLTDSKGEIHLSVPVRGNVSDPHFSVGAAVTQALGDVIGRLVTAPFRLIGRLFGGGDDDALASVGFEPGSAALAPEQREKLDTLAKALQDRPLLRLLVAAPYDAAADTFALQLAATRRQLATLRGDRPADAGSLLIAYDDPATRKAIRTLYAERKPAAASTAKQADIQGDDRAAYVAMVDRIARGQALGIDTPQALAAQRAAGVVASLAARGVDRSRVGAGPVQAVPVGKAGAIEAALTVSAKGTTP